MFFRCLPDSKGLPFILHWKSFLKVGYIAFAADLYGKGKRGQSFEENMALLKPFREDRTNLLRRRLFLGLQCLRDQMAVDNEKVFKKIS